MGRSLDPAVGRRRLRAALQAARTQASLTQKEVAEELGWSVSKLIRIENGQVGVSRTDLKALLDLYHVRDAATVNGFFQMAAGSRRQPWAPYRDVLNAEFITYLGIEGAASVIRQFHPLLIPGLLQTREYAWRVIRSFARPETSEAILGRQLEWRLRRQELLSRDDPPALSVILAESVLRQGVGNQPEDAEIMQHQLDHLRELHSREHIAIRVLPLAFGIHLGLKGPFVLLGFHDPADEDLLYLENDRKTVLTRDQAECRFYREAFVALEEASLAGGEVERLFSDVAASLAR